MPIKFRLNISFQILSEKINKSDIPKNIKEQLDENSLKKIKLDFDLKN